MILVSIHFADMSHLELDLAWQMKANQIKFGRRFFGIYLSATRVNMFNDDQIDGH